MQSIIDNPRAALGAGLAIAAVLLIGWLIVAGADGLGLLSFLVRLVHVLAAMVWVGLVFFVNFVQLVALQAADEQARGFLHKAMVPSVAWWFRHASTLTVVSGVAPAGAGRLSAAVARLRQPASTCRRRAPWLLWVGRARRARHVDVRAHVHLAQHAGGAGPAARRCRRQGRGRARASSCSPGSISCSSLPVDARHGGGGASLLTWPTATQPRPARRRRRRCRARRRARPLPCRPAGPARGARRPAGAGGIRRRARPRAVPRHARAGDGRDPPAVVARCAAARDDGARTGNPVADAVRAAVHGAAICRPRLLLDVDRCTRASISPCEPMADDAALHTYLWKREGALFALAAAHPRLRGPARTCGSRRCC